MEHRRIEVSQTLVFGVGPNSGSAHTSSSSSSFIMHVSAVAQPIGPPSVLCHRKTCRAHWGEGSEKGRGQGRVAGGQEKNQLLTLPLCRFGLHEKLRRVSERVGLRCIRRAQFPGGTWLDGVFTRDRPCTARAAEYLKLAFRFGQRAAMGLAPRMLHSPDSREEAG